MPGSVASGTFFINVVNLLNVHVVATLEAVLREVSHKGYIVYTCTLQEPVDQCTIVSFKNWSKIFVINSSDEEMFAVVHCVAYRHPCTEMLSC